MQTGNTTRGCVSAEQGVQRFFFPADFLTAFLDTFPFLATTFFTFFTAFFFGATFLTAFAFAKHEEIG